jgi:hypothetical protein
MCYNGEGVPQNYFQAANWYRRAADQGNASAQVYLGSMYYKGEGVGQNYAEAVKLYRLAADQGYRLHPGTQFEIGSIYYNGGHGVPQNYAEALRWYRVAAEQGNAEAQVGLGIMYADGRGVPQNYVQVHMWFNLAAAAHVLDPTGLPNSLFGVPFDAPMISKKQKETHDNAVHNRDSIASKMNAAQIAEAQKLASEWKPKQ